MRGENISQQTNGQNIHPLVLVNFKYKKMMCGVVAQSSGGKPHHQPDFLVLGQRNHPPHTPTRVKMLCGETQSTPARALARGHKHPMATPCRPHRRWPPPSVCPAPSPSHRATGRWPLVVTDRGYSQKELQGFRLVLHPGILI